MRVGIVGAGAMAQALGGRWAAAGHEVIIGARSRAKAISLAEVIGARSGSPGEPPEATAHMLSRVVARSSSSTYYAVSCIRPTRSIPPLHERRHVLCVWLARRTPLPPEQVHAVLLTALIGSGSASGAHAAAGDDD
jgi:glutamyl-tRNA reductase